MTELRPCQKAPECEDAADGADGLCAACDQLMTAVSAAVMTFLTDRVPITDPTDPARSAAVCRGDSAERRVLRDVNSCLAQAMCLLMELGTGRRVYTGLGPWPDVWAGQGGMWVGDMGWAIGDDQSGGSVVHDYRDGFPDGCAPHGFQRA